jgi:hypothetical protein
MSLSSALSGETYTARTAFGNPSASASRPNSERIERNAASVFPLPVGARMSVFSPASVCGSAAFCILDGAVKRAENHFARGA